jgi:hypothetical protein
MPTKRDSTKINYAFAQIHPQTMDLYYSPLSTLSDLRKNGDWFIAKSISGRGGTRLAAAASLRN